MERIKTIAFRGGNDLIANLQLCIDRISCTIPDVMNRISGQYNVRCVFEKVENQLTFSDSILGELINQTYFGKVYINDKSDIRLLSPNSSLSEHKIDFSLQGEFNIGVKIFKDKPVHTLPAIDVLPIPVEIITIYFYFSEMKLNENLVYSISDKYFDSYDYLGFILVDLAKMEEIITRKYGNRKLDLIDEFCNTELIDELFSQEIIMITWGIHPYSYPIYSSENVDSIRPLLGREYKQEGRFYIKEDIRELSLIPGYELRKWPEFTQKEWTKISLNGKGKIAHLTPYILEDSEFETVLVSFLIHRSEGCLKESIPLLNVNLLYE